MCSRERAAARGTITIYSKMKITKNSRIMATCFFVPKCLLSYWIFNCYCLNCRFRCFCVKLCTILCYWFRYHFFVFFFALNSLHRIHTKPTRPSCWVESRSRCRLNKIDDATKLSARDWSRQRLRCERRSCRVGNSTYDANVTELHSWVESLMWIDNYYFCVSGLLTVVLC